MNQDQEKLFVPVQRRFAAGFAVLAFSITFVLSILQVDDLLVVTLRATVAFLVFAVLGWLAGLLVMFSSDPRVTAEHEFLRQLEEQEARDERRARAEQDEEHDDQRLTFIGGEIPGAHQVEE